LFISYATCKLTAAMCFAVQNQQLIAAVWCTPYVLLLYSLYCISNLFCNILKCSLLCVQFYLLFSKIPPSTIWFVVYDGMPCWNMIGQNEDRLIYTNTKIRLSQPVCLQYLYIGNGLINSENSKHFLFFFHKKIKIVKCSKSLSDQLSRQIREF
jgi:hypothetical protein